MKNQERAELYQEYHSQVKMYNEITERVIRNKFEMNYLWKYAGLTLAYASFGKVRKIIAHRFAVGVNLLLRTGDLIFGNIRLFHAIAY